MGYIWQPWFDVVGECVYGFCTEYENVKESLRTGKNYAKIKLVVCLFILFEIIKMNYDDVSRVPVYSVLPERP